MWSVHMLNWMCAHAQLEVCTCSIGSIHMLNWSVHMLNWSVRMLNSSVHMLMCRCLPCTCSPESVHMLNWGVHMLNWSVHVLNFSMHMLMCRCQVCTYSPESVCMLNWECAHAQLKCVHAQLKCAHAELYNSEGRAREVGLDPACYIACNRGSPLTNSGDSSSGLFGVRRFVTLSPSQ